MCQADGLNEGTFNFSVDIDTSVRMVFDIQWRRIDLSEPYHLLQTGEKISSWRQNIKQHLQHERFCLGKLHTVIPVVYLY